MMVCPKNSDWRFGDGLYVPLKGLIRSSESGILLHLGEEKGENLVPVVGNVPETSFD
jgi:hypothetical protein